MSKATMGPDNPMLAYTLSKIDAQIDEAVAKVAKNLHVDYVPAAQRAISK